MRRIVSIGIISAGLMTMSAGAAATNSVAGPAKSGPESKSEVDGPVNRLGKELNLNAEQQSKMQAVFEETRAKIQSAVQQAMTNADMELHRILTAEQYQKLQQMEQQQQLQRNSERERHLVEPGAGSK